MRLIWPGFLWCFVLILLLPLAYLWLLRRRRRAALRFSTLAIIRVSVSRWGVWKRHAPPVLLWLGLAFATFGVTRPTAQVTLPADYMTLVLAVDVSRSMLAEDVEPNRIQAAQRAVKDFLQDLPNNMRAGIVSFAGTAQVVQQVTDDRELLIEAVDRFKLQRGTATGSGLLLALSTLLPDSGVNLQSAIYGDDFGGWGGGRTPAPINTPKPQESKKPPVAPGSYENGAIILLSDGRRTHGPDPFSAAKQAAERGVRVYTVAFGTVNGFIPGWEGSNFYAQVDERALQGIAMITEGEFFRAENAKDLGRIYNHLSSKFSMERKDTEITALFGVIGLIFILLALGTSLFWFRRSA